MDMKAEPTPFDQKLFLVFIVTFASMMAFEFAAQFIYPYPPDWRSNLIRSLFVSGLAVIIAYFPLKSYYIKNIEVLSEMKRRRSVETELREREEKYRLLADNATDIVWILDLATGKFTYFSPSVEKIRGYTPEEALEISLEKTLTPESYARAMTELRETLELDKQNTVEHGRIRIFEFQEICKDGSVISTESRIKFIRNAEGVPISIQGISRDITERRRAEKALRKSEERYRSLFEGVPTGRYRTAPSGRILDINPALVQVAGISGP